jgi:hypothetical protein
MQRRFVSLAARVGSPVLVGQFLFDWISSDVRSALEHLPVRASIIVALLLLWASIREHRDRNKRKFR